MGAAGPRSGSQARGRRSGPGPGVSLLSLTRGREPASGRGPQEGAGPWGRRPAAAQPEFRGQVGRRSGEWRLGGNPRGLHGGHSVRQEDVSNTWGWREEGARRGAPQPPARPPRRPRPRAAAALPLRVHVSERTGRAKRAKLSYICNSSNSTPELEGGMVPQSPVPPPGPAQSCSVPRPFLSTRQPPASHARS